MFDRDRLLLILRRLAICAVLVIALAPVLWLFSIAYKPTRDIFASPPTFLFTPTLDNFESVFRYFKLGALLKSSLSLRSGRRRCRFSSARRRAMRWRDRKVRAQSGSPISFSLSAPCRRSRRSSRSTF